MLPEWIKESIRTLLLRKRFSKSVIYSGATADLDSRLEPYSVLFRNAVLQNSSIGVHSYVQAYSVLCNAQVGPFCSIAGNVHIGLASHPTDLVSTSPVFYDNTQPLPFFFTTSSRDAQPLPKTVIGADVWIGQGAIVKAGVVIGVGAVVGAGAVVTKDVSPYGVVVGVPAREVKRRFDDSVCQQLVDSRWWEFDAAKLKQLAPLFAEPNKFLEALEAFKR